MFDVVFDVIGRNKRAEMRIVLDTAQPDWYSGLMTSRKRHQPMRNLRTEVIDNGEIGWQGF